jgi:ZIP family zinc transporter
MHENFLLALGLTIFAGLATGIGSLIAFFIKGRKETFLSFGLGLSAGVMIYVSFMEMLSESTKSFIASSGETAANWLVLIFFLFGIVLTAIIDLLVPEYSNPHETRTAHDLDILEKSDAKKEELEEIPEKVHSKKKLMRMGLFTAFAVAFHNFPEGFATFISALNDPKVGVSIAIAIAIHNIPEGISVSVPIFFATGKRSKAFAYSFLSGLAEPAGALIGYIILRPFLNDFMMAGILSVVAGIMIYISFDELLPTAREYGKGHIVIAGLVIGMAIMGSSLIFLGHGH